MQGDVSDTVKASDRDHGQIETSLIFAGQRKINLIWEYSQATIALAVVATNLIVAVKLAFTGGNVKVEMPSMLENALFVVVGFYFGRTNHSAIGGVGRKPNEEYGGR